MMGRNRSFVFILGVLIFVCNVIAIQSVAAINYYVAPSGHDTADGSQDNPFATVQQAQRAVRRLKQRGVLSSPVNIILRGGFYELSRPLVFGGGDFGTVRCPVVYRAERGQKVVLSGGRRIRGWVKLEGNHWVVSLPEVKAGRWYFRQLFADGRRLQRACLPAEGFYTTAGPLTDYAGQRKYWGHIDQYGHIISRRPEVAFLARCGFRFRPGDIKLWDNWRETEVLTYHRWECSWQTIRRIDLQTNNVYMNSPCRYPVGTFGAHMRYRVENIRAGLTQPGRWYLDGEKGKLHYMARKGEDPRKELFVAPYISRLLVFKGGEQGRSKVSDEKQNDNKVACLRFKNIDFEYAQYKLGIYDIAPNWPAEIRKYKPDFPAHPRPGYTDSQAAPRCGEAVQFIEASYVSFYECRFNHLGAYAVKLGKGSSHISFVGCEMYDLGGGGVIIGFPVRSVSKAGIPPEDAPAYNTVSNCWIHSAGRVHPSAVGIMIAQAHNNIVSHCEINDLSYSGISSGWTWGHEKNYTNHNRIANNYIHNVARSLGDTAALYSLGRNEGSVYYENYLDDIVKGKGVVGVVDAFGFDEGSDGFTVDRNVVGRHSGKFVSFNKRGGMNGWKAHKWIGNNFPVGDKQKKSVDDIDFTAIIKRAGLEQKYKRYLHR